MRMIQWYVKSLVRCCTTNDLHLILDILARFSNSVVMSTPAIVPRPVSVNTATLSAVVVVRMAKPEQPLDPFTERWGVARVML